MLELQGPETGPLDDPLAVRVRGLGPDAAEAGALLWRARLRDDDGRVWRAVAERPQDLMTAFEPAKPGPQMAALRSLRPVRLDLRAEAPDGRGAARTFTRLLLADGVRVRRWRGVLPGAEATLHLPVQPEGSAIAIDATQDPADAELAALTAPLLASRGVVALTVVPAARGRGGAQAATHTDGLLPLAVERLAAVPGAGPPDRIEVVRPLLPPGVPALAPGDADAWDALLAQLGASPRTRAVAP